MTNRTSRISKILIVFLLTLVVAAVALSVINVVPAYAASDTYTPHDQQNGLQIGVVDGGYWTVEDVADKQTKYTAVKNSTKTPSLQFTIEGERYFSFEFKFTANSNASSATNYFTVDIDDVQQCEVSNTGAESAPQEYLMKTRGTGSHTVVLWANGTKNTTAKKQVEMYFQNFRLREESDFTKHNFTIDYDAKVVATYIIEGANGGWNSGTTPKSEEQVQAAATYLAPNQEYPLPEGMAFCLISCPQTYVSSITGEEMTSPILASHIKSTNDKSMGGSVSPWKINTLNLKTTSKGIRQSVNDFANAGSTSFECEGWALKDITCEYAPLPEVCYFENNDINQPKHVLQANETVVLPYGKISLPIRIKTILENYYDYYQVKVNGKATEVSWERIDDEYIGCAINVTERATILVSGWFGENYIYIANGSTSGTLGKDYLHKDVPNEWEVDQKLSFAFNIDVLTENGIDDVLADPQADIAIEQDANYPWYYDSSRSDGGTAFTSGLSGASAVAQKISQLGFTVKGNGVFIFEFQIDGTGDITSTKKSWAAYNISKSSIVATSWVSGTSNSYIDKDFNAYYGFNNKKATNIAYGLSNDSGVSTKHRPSNPVHVQWTDPDDSKLKDDVKSDNYEVANPIHSTQLIEKTEDSEWYRVSIKINGKGDAEETVIWLAHAVYAVSSNYKPSNGFSGERMTVRNVGYYPSETAVSFGVSDGEKDAANGTISVKADGKDVTLQDGIPGEGQIELGARLTLTATFSDDYHFYGWQEIIGENTRIFSYDKVTNYSVMAAEVKIVAIIAKEGTYAVRHGEKFYKPTELQTALNDASGSEDKNIIVVDNATIESGQITIPKGVKLIIPYNAKGAYYEEGNGKNSTSAVSWRSGGTYATPVYKFTFATGATVTVNGELYVGGIIHHPDQSAQGHTSGAYSELVLDGTITVASGGLMDVYGRVTGKGGITVESGGELYQPFLIADYSGGQNTQDLFNQKQTPFNRYAMINIQCAGGYTINYGGELIGHASLYFWSSVTTIDQPFISYPSTVTINGKKGTVTLINLKDGASAHVVYDDNHVRVKNTNSPKTDFWDVVANSEDIGKTVITITGGASAGYMSFPLDIKTNGVAFSIPYNYELNLEGEKAVYDMPYAYKLMPGATLRIGEGATLNLTSKLYVYDWLYQYDMSEHGYPSSSELTSAGYTVNANFIVNGTFNIKSGATFLGVIQTTNTKGTAHINIDNNVTLKVDTKSANHSVYNGLIDGGCTGYDCNFASLTEISACIWDKVHWNNTSEKLLKNAFAEYKNQIYEFLKDLMPEMAQEFVPTAVGQLVQLEAGKSYTSTWLDTDSKWSFKGSPITYCSTHAKTSAANGNHTLQVATPPTIEGLSGSWRVDHDEQDCQWGQYYVADKNAFGLFADEIDAALLGQLGVSDLSNYVGFAYKLCSCVGCDHKIAIILINPSGNEFGWVGAGAVSKGHIEVPYDGGVNTVQAIIDVLKKAATDLFEENGDIKASLKEFASNFNVSLELLKDDSAAQTFNVGKYVLRVTLTDGYYLEGGVGNKTLGSNVWDIEVTIEAATLSEENVQDLVDGKLPSQQYTGSQITFEDLNIQFAGKKLQKGVDYNLSFGGNVNVIDGGTVIVTGIGNFEGSSITLHFDITPISLDGGNGLIEGVLDSYEYTGKSIEPSITVLTADRTHTLEKGEDKDYTVSYSGDNVNVTGQQVTLTVTAHGNYTGTLSAQFTVAAKDMSDADVKVEGSYTYNGQAITPTLAIQFGEYSLVYDADYDIAYTGSGNHTNAGEVQFTVSYKGNFAGSKAGNKFQISPKDISSAVVTFTGQFTYDRNAHTPTRAQLTISGVEGFSDEQIKDGDVKITASDNIAAGENSATVTVEGTGNFAGKATGKFGIGKATISEVNVNGNYTYTGKAQKIVLIVKAGALTLSEGEYEATYSRSDGTAEALKLTNAGAVKVSIAAISDNFQISDDISTEFEIAKRSIVGAKVTVGGVYTYNRNAHKPLAGVITVTIDDLPDVEVTFDVTGYGENTKAGQATVTVTGNGNFEDEATGEFAINKATIDKVVVNGAYTYNGIAQVIDLTVNAGDLQLNDGEYTADFGGNGLINAAKGITVTVNPEDADNFDGSATATFEIKAKDVTVALNKQTWATYNGAEQHASSEQQYWSLKAVDGNAMANDEQPNALHIKLTANGTNAGAYDIEPTWGNTNYNVTFEGKEQAFVIAKASIEIKAKDISSAMGDAIIKDYEYEFLNGTRFFNEQDRLDFEANAELKYACDAENTQIKDYDIVMTIKADFTMTNYDVKTPQKGTYHVTDSIFAGVVFNDARHTYDAQLHKIDVGGTENLDKPSVTFTYHTGDNDWKSFPADGVKDAGTYFIKVYITVDGHESTYEKQAQLVIDKKDIDEATVTVEGEYTYNGSAISPEKAKIKVTLADWNEAITFDFEVSENTNAGTAKVTVTGNGNYKGTAKEGNFTILQRDISNAAVVVGGTYTYNRGEHKPLAQNITVTLADLQGVKVTFKVKDDGAYANNVNATTDALKATVIIEGTGNFKGEATGEFVIGKATINKVTVNGAYTYTGKAQSVSLTVKAGDLQLNDGEYAADFGGNELINAAKGIKVTVTPKDASNFDGSATATFDIAQKDISKASVKVNGTYTYNGNAILPKNEEVELTLDDFADFTFTLSSNDNTDKGTKTLYVAGTGNYTGTATGEFEIVPADLTELALGGHFTYDKTEKKLVDKVMAGEIEVDGEYFDVAYMRNDEPTSDLTSAGKVKVTVTAKEQSNFTGALTQEVEIAKREVNVTLTAQSKPYSKSKPVVENSYNIGETDVLLGDSLDLTVFIVENESNEWNVGKYDLDVEIGNSNYTVGTITGNKNAFEITKRNVQITLKTQNWAVYNGQAQQPSSEDQYWSFADGAILGDDDLHISLSVEGEAKMASSYQLKYAWENENYNVTRGSDGAVFTIGRKHINVTVLEQTALYSGLDNVPAVSQLQNVAWSAQDGAICDGDSDSIGIVVRCETLASRVGDYPISADWTDKQNYDVEFDTSKAMFKVTPVTITITVHGKQSTYGDRAEQLTCDIEGLLDSDRQTVNVNSYFTLSVDVDERTSVGHHDIVCNVSGHPDNYVLNVVNDEGYEVVARKLKVEILDQNDVYGFGKSYAFDDSKWQIVDGNIVNDDDLDITLTAPVITGAGDSYVITGRCGNGNYDVEFEDGKYTVAKLDISAQNPIIFTVNAQSPSEDGTITVTFRGGAPTFFATASVEEGGQLKQLDVTISPDSVNTVGVFDITVSINDPNYAGSKTFKLVVTDRDGRTQRIIEALGNLQDIVGDMQAIEVTLEDFELVKSIAQEIAKLDPAERKLAEDDLAEYMEFIEAYNRLAEVDEEVIAAAKAVADAPIKGLFDALNALSLLATLAYIVIKGGKLI